MNLQHFLNPPAEAAQHDNNDLIQSIVDQFTPQPDHESDEEEERLPKVSIQQALHGLMALRLYEEQQEDGEVVVIQQLNRLEELL